MGVTGADLTALAWHVATMLGGILGPVFAVMMVCGGGGARAAERPRLHAGEAQARFRQAVADRRPQAHVRLEGIMNLVKGLLKIGVVGFAVWTQIWPERNDAGIGDVADPDGRGRRYEPPALQGLMAALGALAAIAAADYLMQRYRFMTAQQDVEAGDQGRVPAERRRPADQGRRSASSVWSAPRSA
ncbi:MAG: EscU/YscU/HrcU family type III secretion system export apparatus switch protein [Rhizomicrobium sp.]